MKTREKILKTFPAALALQAVSAPAHAIEFKKGEHASEITFSAKTILPMAATADVVVATVESASGFASDSFQQQIPLLLDEWGEKQEKAFDALVTKEALQTITPSELAELDELQKVRRRFVNPPSTDELLERLRREKLDRELLQLLQRNVRFQEFAKDKA